MKLNYIAGQWAEGADLRRNINPSDLDDLVGEYAHADAAQTEAAIAAARAAFAAWSRGPLQARADALDRIGAELLARKDELGDLLAREEGKTLPEATAEVARAGQIFRFFAGEVVRSPGEHLPSVRPGVEVDITREPLGVVGIITPWNFPDRHSRLEDRAGARPWQLRGVQAGRPRTGFRLGTGRDHQSFGPARRRVQPRDGAGWPGGPDAARLTRTSPPSASPDR